MRSKSRSFESFEQRNRCFTELKTCCFKNPKNLIMVYLNINLLRSKLKSIKPNISPNFDIYFFDHIFQSILYKRLQDV